jgi:glycerol-1-phosphate dehydrogenase [NAD(P)+]
MSASSPASLPPPGQKLSLAEALSSARETRALVIGAGVVRDTARVFHEQFPGSRAVVVSDHTTYSLAGRAVDQALTASGVKSAAPFIYPDAGLYAEIAFVEQLDASLRRSAPGRSTIW